MPAVNRMWVCLRLVVAKAALGRVLLWVLQFSPVNITPPVLHSFLHYPGLVKRVCLRPKYQGIFTTQHTQKESPLSSNTQDKRDDVCMYEGWATIWFLHCDHQCSIVLPLKRWCKTPLNVVANKFCLFVRSKKSFKMSHYSSNQNMQT
jgi:hypothetical protein